VSDAPQLRRADKQMTADAAAELLRLGYCGRLASVGADGWPYVVPLLYVFRDGEIWVHNSRAPGHLRANVDHQNRVCFEVDEPGQVFPYGRYECDTSIAYRSAVAFGRIRVEPAQQQKQAFFESFMTKYQLRELGRPRNVFPRLDHVTVYAIAIERITGKETALPPPDKQWPMLDLTKSPR